MERTALSLDPAASERQRRSGRGGPQARTGLANSRNALSSVTASVAAARAGELTAVALRDAVAVQSCAIAPTGYDGDVESRPDLAMLHYLRALDALLHDRDATMKTADHP